MRSKKHLEKEKQNEIKIPEGLFQEPIENKVKKIYNPKSLKRIAKENKKLDDKQKKIAKKMNNPYYFTDRNLKIRFRIILDSHHINLANSNLNITPNFPEFRIEVRFIKKIIKEL